MADGIAISGRCLNHHEWLLTLGRCYCLFLADVIAMVHDRCYCHIIKADVVAPCMFVLWQMLLPCSVRQMLLPILCGRC